MRRAFVAVVAISSFVTTLQIQPAARGAGARTRSQQGQSVQTAPVPGQVASPVTPPRQPGAPPRDGAQPATGTAAIRGRVVSAETGAPLRRVTIRAFAMDARPVPGQDN